MLQINIKTRKILKIILSFSVLYELCFFFQIVATFIEEAKLQGIPVSSAAWNDDRNIFITLDRSALFREVLQQVHRQGDNYGKQSTSCSDDKTQTDFIVLNNSDLFHADQSEAVQLGSIRSALITECLFNLLKAYGLVYSNTIY